MLQISATLSRFLRTRTRRSTIFCADPMHDSIGLVMSRSSTKEWCGEAQVSARFRAQKM